MSHPARKTFEAFLADVRDAGLGAHEDRILAGCVRCTYAVLGEPGEALFGESRVGGDPDLPHGMTWPADDQGRPMRFALQANMADLPDPGAHGLPATGVLSLFVGASDRGDVVPHKVFLFHDVDMLDRRSPPAFDGPELDEWLPVLAPHALAFLSAVEPSAQVLDDIVSETQDRVGREGATPPWEHPEVVALQAHAWRYHDLCGEGTYPARTVAKIGGRSIDWDRPPAIAFVRDELLGGSHEHARSETALRAAAAWKCLLVLCSVDELDLVIGDAGVLQILIHEASLEAGWFSSTRATMTSS